MFDAASFRDSFKEKLSMRKYIFLLPVLKLMDRVSFSPNFLSVLGLIFGLSAAFSLNYFSRLEFFIFILLAFIFDVLDGSLARYQKKNNFWIDYISDRIFVVSVSISMFFLAESFSWFYLLVPVFYVVSNVLYSLNRDSSIIIYFDWIYLLFISVNYCVFATYFAFAAISTNIILVLFCSSLSARLRNR